MKQTLHFCPKNAFFGDTMPIKTSDGYHVFYNKLINGLTNKTGTLIWGHTYSPDLVHWEDYPDALLIGEKGTLDDKHCYSGSVIEKDGTYYIFYTGISEGSDGKKKATILKAVSRDLIHWEKYNKKPLLLQPEEYYRMDGSWRDPCVFYHPEEKCYWMFLCAREAEITDDLYSGTMGLAKSEDLEHWTVCPPYWTPRVSTVFECANVFPYEDMWVMTYFWHETRCRVAVSPNGPWLRPAVEAPDYFDHFAGRTCLGTDNRRILFGWIPRKDADGAKRTWGGNMAIPREWYLLPDRTPATRCAGEVLDYYHGNGYILLAEQCCQVTGNWEKRDETLIHNSLDGGMVLLPETPQNYLLEGKIRFCGRNSSASIMIRTKGSETKGRFASSTDEGYKLIFDSAENIIHLRDISEFDQKNDVAYIPYEFGKEEYVDFQLFVHDDIVEAFVGNKKSLISRLMLYPTGKLAIHAQDGIVEFHNLKLYRI